MYFLHVHYLYSVYTAYSIYKRIYYTVYCLTQILICRISDLTECPRTTYHEQFGKIVR